MFQEHLLEQKIASHEKRIQELERENESLTHAFSSYLKEMDLSQQQIGDFLSNPLHFSPGVWKELQQQKKVLDEKLQKELDNIRRPMQNKKRHAERNVQQHWLFVR